MALFPATLLISHMPHDIMQLTNPTPLISYLHQAKSACKRPCAIPIRCIWTHNLLCACSHHASVHISTPNATRVHCNANAITGQLCRRWVHWAARHVLWFRAAGCRLPWLAVSFPRLLDLAALAFVALWTSSLHSHISTVPATHVMQKLLPRSSV